VGTMRFLGSEAAETSLQAAILRMGRWRAVHLDCHGLVDPARSMGSALARAGDAENGGLLTALEVFRRRVPADLAVLSAWETGKGKVQRTDGIVGLTRALPFAGAPRVLCLLWKVDGHATQVLVARFYELRKDGLRGRGVPGTGERRDTGAGAGTLGAEPSSVGSPSCEP